MDAQEIKQAISGLPDREIGDLYNWLHDLVHTEVWPRQVASDVEMLGVERWLAALDSDMDAASPKRHAALRLLKAKKFDSAEDREKALKDLAIVLEDALD